MIDLSERKRDLESQTEVLRRQHGAAVLDGVQFDVTPLLAAESEMEAISVAEGEMARRHRAETATAEAMRIAGVREKLGVTETHRLEAVERAERAARDLAGALSEARHYGKEATRMLRSLGVHPSMELDHYEQETRLSMRLSATMRSLTGLSGRFGNLHFSTKGDRRFDAGWREAEQAVALPNIQKAMKG